MNFDKLPETMTTQELARFLRVCDETVVNAIHKGKLSAIKLGNRWRISKDAVVSWLTRL